MPEYTIYIANYCSACEQVKRVINENNYPCKIINTDEQTITPPFPLMVYPALLKSNKLLAYGKDICTYLEKIKFTQK